MHCITRTNDFCGPSLKMLIAFGLKREIKAERDENWASVTEFASSSGLSQIQTVSERP